jgi:maltooligosyltrehalose trehalohydrolase
MKARQFGPQLIHDGARFRLWAPAAKRVDVMLEQPHAMTRGEDGWFMADIAGVTAGARYKLRIDDEIDVPDPGSDFQPDDVFGASEVIDHANFAWRANDWRGRPWQEAVIVEAHVGAFTPAGSYRAMIEHLDHLVETGITALELLPLADFAGSRNWGYDGVLWYAPDSAYGRPEDLKTLIDEAHLRGLMVMLDVVYNHFGPEGNYLGLYAPIFFTEAHTPWGSAIDYRVPQVRAFAIENALHWLRDYRFDGLRLDAVNSIVEPGGLSLLHDLSAAAGDLARETGRHIHLVLENGDNRASILDAAQDPPGGKYRAQWNDDYHHAWRVLMTAEKQGYYCDYQRAPRDDIARSLSSGFIYQGEMSAFRGGARGEPSGALSPMAFINFLQNHDQIGNRPLGDRLESVARTEAIEAALAVMLLAPAIPMLFMGEEWGSKTPFPFFCDFQGGLADAVRQGRRSEYEWAYAEYGDEVPDALDLSTFQSAVLDWDERRQATPQKRLRLVRDLLAIRRKEVAPRLAGAVFGEARATENGLLTADWRMGDGATLALLANLSDRDVSHATTKSDGTLIWGSELNSSVPTWSVVWRLG